MAIPKYNELYSLFLFAIQDGAPHSSKDVKKIISQKLQLTTEELAERLPSQRQPTFDNRVNWAKTYLKKAGLIDSPRRGIYIITKEGLNLLASGVQITNDLLKNRYPAFSAFVSGVSIAAPSALDGTPSSTVSDTPQETLERTYSLINEQLADDLLSEVMQQSPAFFEQLVVDLMKAMDYGDGFVTKYSGDGGVDGIIHEDKLGFNLIYIQAKRWDPSTTIGKPELQKFAGAMMGPPKIEKGLFITTAKFSQGAKDFANAQHIILVDGQKLTTLMIEYSIGVSVEKTYYIKRIIGLPGETVQVIDGYMYINGKKLDEHYGAEVMEDPGIAAEPIKLGDDEYFVLGDNRNHSSDSRVASVGVLTRDMLIGRAWVRIYPFNKIGVINHE